MGFALKCFVILALFASLFVGAEASIATWHLTIAALVFPLGGLLALIPSILLGISSVLASLYGACAILCATKVLLENRKNSAPNWSKNNLFGHTQ